MRTLILDQFEFDCPDSEESLTITISDKKHSPSSLAAFAGATVGVIQAASSRSAWRRRSAGSSCPISSCCC
jgi:hypothetical protein